MGVDDLVTIVPKDMNLFLETFRIETEMDDGHTLNKIQGGCVRKVLEPNSPRCKPSFSTLSLYVFAVCGPAAHGIGWLLIGWPIKRLPYELQIECQQIERSGIMNEPHLSVHA